MSWLATLEKTTFCDSLIRLIALMRSRSCAAFSNCIFSAHSFIRRVSSSTDWAPPPRMYSSACSRTSAYSSCETRPRQTPMHCLIWKLRQGRPLPNSCGNLRVQVGSRKARFTSSTVSLTTKEEMYGPI